MTSRVTQQAHGGGVNTFDFAVTHHQVEHADNGFRLAFEQGFVTQVDQIAAQLEMLIQRTWLFIRANRQNRFIKQL